MHQDIFGQILKILYCQQILIAFSYFNIHIVLNVILVNNLVILSSIMCVSPDNVE